MPKEQSSEELSSLAARVLKMEPLYASDDARASPDERWVDLVDDYDTLLTYAKRLAGSVLSQDETPKDDCQDA